MHRTRKRYTAVIAAAAVAVLMGSGLLAVGTAPPGQAAQARDGVCESGEFCYYYNSDHAGSVSDFDGSVADYGTTQPSCFDFKGPGNGQGQCVKNEAASVWNRSARTVRVYYNSNPGGTYQAVASGAKVNLGPALYNNNASHKFGPFVAVPSSRPSYYISSQNTTWARNVGCSIGTSDKNQAGKQVHTVVLAFGKTTRDGDGVHRLSYFGGTDRPFTDARRLVVAMGKGYDGCTGSDTTSVLRIGLGTSNYPGSAVTGAAGRALARAAKGATNDLAGSQATAWGAVDFEAWGAGSGLNAQSRNMLDGYNAVTGRRPLVNFGSADGCPTSSVPAAGSCNAGLNADTIWYVSTRGAARPLPEIYTTTGSQAKQWKFLSLYAHRKGAAMSFPAVMAQQGACDQRGGCAGTDNGPATAWTQLNEQLDSDSRIETDPGAPTNIHWQQSTAAVGSRPELRAATDPENAWPAGIFADPEAPARGAEFVGSNRWVGQVDGATLIVWAGRSGTAPGLGRLIVAAAGADQMIRSHDVVGLPGAGALRVVSAHQGVLTLVDEHGTRHAFDTRTRTFR